MTSSASVSPVLDSTVCQNTFTTVQCRSLLARRCYTMLYAYTHVPPPPLKKKWRSCLECLHSIPLRPAKAVAHRNRIGLADPLRELREPRHTEASCRPGSIRQIMFFEGAFFPQALGNRRTV